MVYKTLLLPALAALLVGATAHAATPISVPTLEVGARASAAGFEIDGTLQARQQATLAAQASGRVLALTVKAGDRVKAGQTLLRIDERELQAGVAGGDAAVAQAQAALTQAQQQMTRTRDLRQQGFVSSAALDTAQAQLLAAQAALQQAQAGRSQATLARGHALLTAPFDGVVLATLIEAGELAAPGRPVLTLYAPGQMRAVLQVPASRAAAVRGATGVEVQLPGGSWVSPAARTELPGTDPVTQTIEWRLDLSPAASAGQTPGRSVRVRFSGTADDVTGASQAIKPVTSTATAAQRLSLPASAVLRRGELTAVYVAQDQHFVLRAVRLGSAQGSDVEVLAGLKAGERIALDPVRAGLTGATPATR